MPIRREISEDENTVTLYITGRFDISNFYEFSQSYRGTVRQGMNYIIDLAGVEWMDSSALGILLLLRERAGGDKTNVTLRNMNKEIMHLIKISNFERLFQIEW